MYDITPRLFLIVLSFLIFESATADPSFNSIEELTSVPLTLLCNDQDTSQIIYAFHDDDDHFWVKEDTFKACRLPSKLAKKHIIQDEIYYCLSDVEEIKYLYNPTDLTLNLIFATSILPVETIDMNPMRLSTLRPEHPGVYINYDITLQRESFLQTNNSGLLTDIIFFNGWGVGESSQILQHHYRRHCHDRHDFARLNTRWTLDKPESMSTWRFGDGITGTVTWSGAVRFGGIQYATNFATQPGFVPFPLPAFRGEAVVPSAVNFYLDNQLRASEKVSGGPFQVEGIPAITGDNTIVVQTQDILGRQTLAVLPYYVSQQFLQEGLTSFSYEMGFIRKDYGISSNDYDNFLAVGTFQQGFTPCWTGGWHAEVLGKQQTFGVNSGFILFDYLESQFAVAMSHDSHKIGGLFLAGLRRLTPAYSMGIQVITTSDDFRQIGFVKYYLTPKLIIQANANYNHPFLGTFGVSFTNRLTRAPQNLFENPDPNFLERIDPEFLGRSSTNFYERRLEHINITMLNYSRTLHKNLFLIFNYIHQGGKFKTNAAYLSFVWSPWNNYTAAVGYQKDQGENAAFASFSKSLPSDNGYGYHLLGSLGRHAIQEADFSLQTDYGLYRALISRVADTNNYELDASGSVLHFMHQTMAARKIDNSFVLVRVPELNDIPVYDNNLIIGRTNRKGYYLIPQTLPYQDNIISIQPTDLPFSTLIGTDVLNAIPYYRSGAYVEFPISEVYHITFNLFLNEDKPILPGAMVVLENGHRYPVGYDGKVFISENQVSEVLNGEVYWKDKSCRFTAHFDSLSNAVTDLGMVQCSSN